MRRVWILILFFFVCGSAVSTVDNLDTSFDEGDAAAYLGLPEVTCVETIRPAVEPSNMPDLRVGSRVQRSALTSAWLPSTSFPDRHSLHMLLCTFLI
jgi:hypothetical protein